MTREEAIQILSTRDAHGVLCGYTSGVTEALDMAIEALQAEAAQGEWIEHKGKWVDFDFYPTKYECNQCHYCVDEGYDSIFCPNCGARMKTR